MIFVRLGFLAKLVGDKHVQWIVEDCKDIGSYDVILAPKFQSKGIHIITET